MSKSRKRKHKTEVLYFAKCFPKAVMFPLPLFRADGGAGRDRTDDLKLAKLALSQLSYGPVVQSAIGITPKEMVGLGRLELPTSRLSSARSNQLSYRPNSASAPLCDLKERETKTAVSRKWTVTFGPYIQMTLR